MYREISLQPLIDEISLDIYHAYDDKKKRMVELPIILGFCVMLFEEFLKGFFDFEKLGRNVRQELEKLFNDSKTGSSKSSIELEKHITVLVEDILRTHDVRKINGKKQATSKIEGFLIGKNIPANRTKILSKNIVDLIEKQLKL